MKPKKYVEIDKSGTQTIHYINRKSCYHREDGPAFIQKWGNGDYYEAWFYDNAYHRYGAPAVKYGNGNVEYWVHGNSVTHKIEEWLDEKGRGFESLSDVEKWELELFMRSL